MLRNAEIRALALYSAAVIALGTAACAVWPGFAWIAALGMGAALAAGYGVFTAWRYQKLRALASYLAAVYNGARVLDIRSNEEGELSILRNDLYKITVALQQQADELAKDKQFLADSLGDISHQLKTPLTSALVLADLLGDESLPAPRRQDFLRSLTGQLTRMQWLVAALLKLSRLDAGAVTLQPAPTPVAALVGRALEPLQVAMELQGVALNCDLPDGLAWQVDPAWTAEAIENLAKNCIEQMPNGGALTITAQDDPLGAALRIEDTGGGFDPADLPHLFDRFYTAHTRPDGHAGIGLALAQSVVRRQGGRITAENLPGRRGARFTLALPKCPV